MKTAKRLLLTLALLVLAGYSVFTTMRVRQLEARLSKVELAQRTSTPVTYAFDDSFIQYFGPKGIDAVDRVMRRGATHPDEIANEAARELKLQSETAAQPRPGRVRHAWKKKPLYAASLLDTGR